MIALKPSYHGNTMLALSASARETYRAYLARMAHRRATDSGALRVSMRL